MLLVGAAHHGYYEASLPILVAVLIGLRTMTRLHKAQEELAFGARSASTPPSLLASSIHSGLPLREVDATLSAAPRTAPQTLGCVWRSASIVAGGLSIIYIPIPGPPTASSVVPEGLDPSKNLTLRRSPTLLRVCAPYVQTSTSPVWGNQPPRTGYVPPMPRSPASPPRLPPWSKHETAVRSGILS